jgi:tripartite-type tricarboxylate transporter receptor subunit TctC
VNSPFRTVGELLRFAKANPGKLRASGSTFGGPWHLALAGLLRANGVGPDAVTWIATDGGAGVAIQDLTAGALDFVVMPAALAVRQLKDGSARALAVFGKSRSAKQSTIPTVEESGASSFTFEYWLGLAAPAGMASDVKDRLVAELTRATTDSAFASALDKSGVFEKNVVGTPGFAQTLSDSDAEFSSWIARIGTRK